MKTAIIELELHLQVLETNEPINRSEGNIAQADLEVEAAKDIRRALKILKAVEEE